MDLKALTEFLENDVWSLAREKYMENEEVWVQSIREDEGI